MKEKTRKISIICAKGNLEDVYAALVLANGAVMEGIETRMFFTFFGLDAITKKGKRYKKLHTATVGNPALRLPNGWRMPTWLGIIPGMEAFVSWMMKKKMAKLDIPDVEEFIDLITAGGGEIYACKLAMEMFGLTKDDLLPQVKDVLTVGDFYSISGGDQSQIIFT